MSEAERRAWSRMTWIWTDEELNRFTFLNGIGAKLYICVDVHGLACREARRMIQNLMLLIREGFDLRIIHGYRHGCAIKDMLWHDYDHRRLAGRRNDGGNSGATLFQVA